jgi:hypothetical protein
MQEMSRAPNSRGRRMEAMQCVPPRRRRSTKPAIALRAAWQRKQKKAMCEARDFFAILRAKTKNSLLRRRKNRRNAAWRLNGETNPNGLSIYRNNLRERLARILSADPFLVRSVSQGCGGLSASECSLACNPQPLFAAWDKEVTDEAYEKSIVDKNQTWT